MVHTLDGAVCAAGRRGSADLEHGEAFATLRPHRFSGAVDAAATACAGGSAAVPPLRGQPEAIYPRDRSSQCNPHQDRLAPPNSLWQVFFYLCAAIPNHTYKLVQCSINQATAWYGWLLGPAICGHWLVLLASQRYYFAQCACSAWGCWTPGTVMMLLGESYQISKAYTRILILLLSGHSMGEGAPLCRHVLMLLMWR